MKSRVKRDRRSRPARAFRPWQGGIAWMDPARPRRNMVAVASLYLLLAVLARTVPAQTPAPPPVPSPTLPSGGQASAPKPPQGSLEERLLRMEEANRKAEEAARRAEQNNEVLRKQLEELSKKYDDVSRLLEASESGDPEAAEPGGAAGPRAGAVSGRGESGGAVTGETRGATAVTGGPNDDAALSTMMGGAGGGIR